MTLEEDTRRSSLKFSRLLKFDQEIRRFDVILDLIQKHNPDNVKVWDRIAAIRDDVFKLQQLLRGVEIEVFAAPWIEFDDDDGSSDSFLEPEEDE
jgi:hypothetical protein